MEKQNQTLTEILGVLSRNWDDLKDQPAEQIKEKLKSCIFIKVEEHELVNKRGLLKTGVNILKYENDKKKTNKLQSWEYNSLNEQEKEKNQIEKLEINNSNEEEKGEEKDKENNDKEREEDTKQKNEDNQNQEQSENTDKIKDSTEEMTSNATE